MSEHSGCQADFPYPSTLGGAQSRQAYFTEVGTTYSGVCPPRVTITPSLSITLSLLTTHGSLPPFRKSRTLRLAVHRCHQL